MKTYDVVALGELLIDFTECGHSPQGNPLLEANPGGAPCNVLAMLSKLGHKTAFIGAVGEDRFGHQLEQELVDAGIDTTGLVKRKEVPTTLAFVHTAEDGDRSFSFYRDPGADMTLSPEDVYAHMELLKDCKIFHFGSLSMTHETCRQATVAAVTAAKAAGALISFDPNLREPLWDCLEQAREQIGWALSQSDLVKMADNEIGWFTGESDPEKAAELLRGLYPNIRLLTVSLGRDGSMAFINKEKASVPGYIRTDTIETTGAGDAFCGCVLDYILENGANRPGSEELEKMLSFSNVAASIVTTKKGALKVMPDKMQIINAYMAGKLQGKQPGCNKKPMHVCQHTGQEPCQFHTPHHHELLESL